MMNNFNGGGQKKPNKFLGGRPREDANYGAKKKSFGNKPSFGGKGGGRGNDRGGNRGGDRGRQPLQMFSATCAHCGKDCEVPFKPDGSKPVLCSECFGKNKSDNRTAAPRPQHNHDHEALLKQVASLEVKINKMLELLEAHTAAQSEVPEKEVKPKKAAVAKKVVRKTDVTKKVVKRTADKIKKTAKK